LSSFFHLLCKLIGKRTGIEELGGVTGAFGLVNALLHDCLSSWRRITVMKPFLNVFRKFNEKDLEIPVLVLSTIPSASTRLIVASLYIFPLTVLRSSASAGDTNSVARITMVAFCGVYAMNCACFALQTAAIFSRRLAVSGLR
jgi:hypothetical protein